MDTHFKVSTSVEMMAPCICHSEKDSSAIKLIKLLKMMIVEWKYIVVIIIFTPYKSMFPSS